MSVKPSMGKQATKWAWWEQYEEVADELDSLGEPLSRRAADDIRTLVDGLRRPHILLDDPVLRELVEAAQRVLDSHDSEEIPFTATEEQAALDGLEAALAHLGSSTKGTGTE